MTTRPTVALYDPDRRTWRCFQRPGVVIQTHEPGAVQSALREIEHLVASRGYIAAGFLAYDAAPAFDAALTVQGRPEVPLLWFGLFDDGEEMDALPSPAWDDRPTDWVPSVDRANYEAAIGQVRDHIARGETYQVNYTLRLRSAFDGDPWRFFRSLVEGQHARYAAYVETDQHAICSASPELFLELDGSRLRSRPMKGTAPRGDTPSEERLNAEWLHQSTKNRAENAMIVDMIRNDMGKISEVGTVHVPQLFDIESYPTVLQMTSTVESRTTATFHEILQALFPCASITGAPKARTMEIISQLETAPRGVYTGAIGYLGPNRQARFNVAIRTAVVDLLHQRAEYGVGGGIVWDSDPTEEFEECQVKARVLAGKPHTRARTHVDPVTVKTSPSEPPR